ncbi:hemerythrin domain-containing protein [Mesobacillus sp. AQ2]|uniref:hemerythrin domain-containing protein n=1 Tax=Bacillaceae TaxID=186817 RepID=UPI00119D2ACF|nr:MULTISPECIES: hemerythrin domain-containing protein [Bacillaceae]MCM3124996.1 hemerythrin domain-containing protein [Mesobacillus sp. MER 33]MCM3235244.1 hemerythrin domain-containing protein [Mesobacillus sp. MER 48]WHX39829.1 hemerythrin domain-containing protein [Mesobacillus sp. AQ2]
MSGPALKNHFSHQSIHDGYYTEGRDLTELLVKLFREEREEDCAVAADALVEHWETRTIAHADSEEEGFYMEIMEKKPELKEEVIKLIRDHDLIRMIVADVKGRLPNEGVTEEVIDRFKTILHLVDIHNHEEERILFRQDHHHLDQIREQDEKPASGQ